MDIGLYDIDSKIPNLAIMKLSAWHKSNGDKVEWAFPLKQYDKVYGSKIFTDSKYDMYPNLELGGSGVSLDKNLPQEIDDMKPDYSIYPECNYSIGFTTRGCIRQCSFCIVWKKEGTIREYRKIKDIWRGGNLILMDNNILALPHKFIEVLSFCKDKKIKVDFNQGLDCRIMTKELANICKEYRKYIKPEIRFAFDDLNYRDAVERTCKLLGFRAFWYVYCDENWEDALERLLILKRFGQRTYLMRNKRVRGKGFSKWSCLANWSNCMGAMCRMDFYDWVHYYKDRNYFKREVADGQK